MHFHIDNEPICNISIKSDCYICDFNQKHKKELLSLEPAPDEVGLREYLNIALSSTLNLFSECEQNQFVKICYFHQKT